MPRVQRICGIRVKKDNKMRIKPDFFEWRGKFNASHVYQLLSSGKNGEVFGEGALTHIMDRAIQMTTTISEVEEPGDKPAQLTHGDRNELEAYLHYMDGAPNPEVKYFGPGDQPDFVPKFGMLDEFICYPDGGVVGADKSISFGIEIKCPFNSLIHFERLRWTSQWDIKEKYMQCYAQIQANMMYTGASEWHFVSYDPRQVLKRLKIKVIPVFGDVEFQEDLVFRIKEAVKEKYKIISEYLGVEVLNRADFIEKIQSFL